MSSDIVQRSYSSSDTSSNGVPQVKPTIFHARGHAPDVRLLFVGVAEFHVHSVVLKLKSQFFFKFLDPANQPAASTRILSPGEFRYEWVAHVEEDGSWSLMSARDKSTNFSFNAIAGNVDDEINAFTTLLQAIYGIPCPLNLGLQDIEKTCLLADYYLALPALSASLSDILRRAKLFIGQTNDSEDISMRLLPVAVKCRHRDLFQECMIFITGLASDIEEDYNELPDYSQIVDLRIQKLAFLMKAELESLIMATHKQVTAFCLNKRDVRVSLASIEASRTTMAAHYWSMYNWAMNKWEENHLLAEGLSQILKPLLHNRTVFHATSDSKEDDTHLLYFLCGEVRDEDLPWDANQLDW